MRLDHSQYNHRSVQHCKSHSNIVDNFVDYKGGTLVLYWCWLLELTGCKSDSLPVSVPRHSWSLSPPSYLYEWFKPAYMHQSTPAITLPDRHTWDASRNYCKNRASSNEHKHKIHNFLFSALIHSSDLQRKTNGTRGCIYTNSKEESSAVLG